MGTVRITAPMFMAHLVLPEIIATARQRYPQIQIELVPDDSEQSLIYGEADIAVRTFASTQHELVTRRIGALSIAVVASTDYLERRGTPQTPAELITHDLIGFDRNPRVSAIWNLLRQGLAAICEDQG
ncbi:MAG: LysR substrate-binding domain-containing protein [Burkholderiaceae bacterium]